MTSDEFRKNAHEIVDFIYDFYENINDLKVTSGVAPSDIFNQFPESPNENGEPFDEIFKDFQNIIMPGMTHWQHPNFFAYFPANSSYPSLLGEFLTAALGAQCMSWVTSPAATELEELVMNWLSKMIGLSEHHHGVIQDTASTATLVAILTAREKKSDYKINKTGIGSNNFTVYCTSEAHSSIEKAVKISGIGSSNLRKIDVDSKYSLIPEKLEKQIVEDKNSGFVPLCVVSAYGTTGSTAIDPIEEVDNIAKKHGIWHHIDAAFAGSALILPEIRGNLKGIELADSFVFNPHKWLMTNFDCSAYFVRDKEALIRTFEILPEYLKTKENAVNNYRDWGIQLGRRFRALKLWFVIRSFGVEGLRNIIRNHINLSDKLYDLIEDEPDFEILAPKPFNTICFRYHPIDENDIEILNEINLKFLEMINQSGEFFLTHTKLSGRMTIRIVTGQTNLKESNIESLWNHLIKCKNMLK